MSVVLAPDEGARTTELSLHSLRNRKIRLRGQEISWDNILAGYMLGRSAWLTAKKVREWDRKRKGYKITVSSSDMLYAVLQPWLLERIPEPKRRVVRVESRRIQKDNMLVEDSPGGSNRSEPTPVMVRYDGSETHQVIIEGHVVHVSVENEEDSSRMIIQERGSESVAKKMVFGTYSSDGRDAVLRMLRRISLEVQTERRIPSLWTMNTWDSWEHVGNLPRRPVASVVAAPGVIETVMHDVRVFLDSGHRYASVSAPYHRGYLFHGPPGTGKTSLARAIASEFDLDLYYLPLASVKGDAELAQKFSRIRDGVLLLEDVDVFHATREREDAEQGVTLSGLLNVLDGAVTPSGLIVIMTTNDRSVLDEAVIRPGRVNMEVEMGLIGPAEVLRLFENFYPDLDARARQTILSTGHEWEIVPAAVTSAMLANMDDPWSALEEVQDAWQPVGATV